MSVLSGGLALLLALGCGGAPAPSQAPPPAAAPVEPLDHLVRAPPGVGPEVPLPLVVALHGRGDAPERFQHLLDGLEVQARVLVPRAPEPWARGASWFPIPARDADPLVLAEHLRRRADQIAALVDEVDDRYATRGRPVVVGFSQGGMLAFALAVTHPQAFEAVVPIAGFVPRELIPEQGVAGARVRVRALHGDADELVPAVWGRRTVDLLRVAGFDATFEAHEGVGHAVPGPVRARMETLIHEALGDR